MRRSADTAAIVVAFGLGLTASPGCDDETSAASTGSGGTGPAGSVGSSVASGSGSSATSGGGGSPTCRDLVEFGPRCDACLVASCCREVELWGGIGAPTEDLDLLGCVKGNCDEPCLGLAGAPVGAPECGALPLPPPSAGACVTVAGAIECNPVTNDGCDAAAGEACDATDAGGLACFPAPNDAALCAQCSNDNGPFCAAGSSCVGDGGTTCAAYCCDDADCGAGTCFQGAAEAVFPAAPAVGVCVAVGAGGRGGAGGAGGTGGS